MAKRAVIVGAGFGGMAAARGLAGLNGLHVTVIDRRNHHLFQPLLYQVAMAGLSPAEIARPIRGMLSRARNTDVIHEDVVEIVVDESRVATAERSIPFDYLILACGATDSYFGHDEWARHAPGLKSIEQATEIRRRVLTAFERAEWAENTEQRKEFLTFVVVGGGPTGVELAGAIGEMSRFTLAKDFRHIDPSLARVILVEAGPRIVPAFSEKLSRRVVRDLERLGVQVWTDCRVTQIDEHGVSAGQERVQARTVLWAAGVRPSPLNEILAAQGHATDKKGRLCVGSDLSLANRRNIFVVGDQASFIPSGSDTAIPAMAPAAMQGGRHVARVIAADLRGKGRPAFSYRDKGQMATIGRRRAVAETKKFKLTGLTAWLAWLLVHIYYLTGFKNRLFVLFQWGYSHLTYHRGARLIVDTTSVPALEDADTSADD